MSSHMNPNTLAVLTLATLLSATATAQTPTPPPAPPTFEDTVQVTATRFGDPVAEGPESITVITPGAASRCDVDLALQMTRVASGVFLDQTGQQ